MSGVDLDHTDQQIRKGAGSAVTAWLETVDLGPVAGTVEEIAVSGGTPLVVAERSAGCGRVLGVVHLKDVVKPGIAERFAQLRAMGIRTVMITGDNASTARAIAAEAGVDDFLAEATPEDKMRLIKAEQSGGRMVAMTGDGTNDAPALAAADVGVAMNSGTSAAKEAGNMIDLDSDPTKLIDVVEIGKQLLITRGALTTFSVANDIAKYFAIIPALFLAAYPGLAALNVMRLHSPQTAILSAVIFNALVIVALIPLAMRGVRYRPVSASRLLRRNLAIYGVGGIVGTVRRHQDHRSRPRRPRHPGAGAGSLGRHHARIRTPAGHRLKCCWSSPSSSASAIRCWCSSSVTSVCSTRPRGSLVSTDGRVVASRLIGQSVQGDEWFQPRPSAGDHDGLASGGSNAGPNDAELAAAVEQRRAAIAARDGVPPAEVPADAVTASGSGLDPFISPAYAFLQVERVARSRDLPADRVRALVAAARHAPDAGFPGPTPGQCGRAQPGPAGTAMIDAD